MHLVGAVSLSGRFSPGLHSCSKIDSSLHCAVWISGCGGSHRRFQSPSSVPVLTLHPRDVAVLRQPLVQAGTDGREEWSAGHPLNLGIRLGRAFQVPHLGRAGKHTN